MNINAFRLSLLTLSVSVLAACGGGGSDSKTNIEPSAPAPADNPALTLIKHDNESSFDGTGVRVAVYDTGINVNHDQFSGLNLSQFSGSYYSFTTAERDETDSYFKIIAHLKETPGDDEDEDFSSTNSGNTGHGTAVSSTIAGETLGVSPDVELIAIDINNLVTTDGNFNVIDVNPVAARPSGTAALLHTAVNAKLLNINFANYSISKFAKILTEPSISDEYIWDDIAKTDVGMIIAAGNEGYSYSDIWVNTVAVPECTQEEFDEATGFDFERCYALKYDRHDSKLAPLTPKYQDLAVIVSAVNDNLELERYSNFPGDSCKLQERWISAPGTVTAATSAIVNDPASTTVEKGTSFAAPLVTGAAAAVAEAFPGLSNRGVLRLLLSTADRSFAGYNAKEHGQGLLDLEAALAANPADYADGVTNNFRKICP